MTSTKKCNDWTLAEILDILEEEDDVQDIFIEPPTVNELTDEDSDEEMGSNINSLSRNQLLAPAEIGEPRGKNEVVSEKSDTSKKPRKLRKEKIRVEWINVAQTTQPDEFPLNVARETQEMTGIQLFELFFDDELIELIISASTEYCLSKNWPDIMLSKEELRVFFAILIVSEYNTLPSKSMYWNTGDDLRNIAIFEAMRRDRFDKIMQSLHFQPNSNLNKEDKYCKLRPLILHLQKKFMKYYVPSEAISHDEAMVEYFGKHSCKQAIRNKPIRFGYKIWCQNSASGYLMAFDPYQGKTFQQDGEMESKFGKCSSTILHLLDQYPLSKSLLPYHVFCDNLFTTFPLLDELKDRGYNGTGTIRANRLGKDCSLLDIKEFEKRERGYVEVATVKFNGTNIFLSSWKDNSIVTVASTCLAAQPEGCVTRWSKRDRKYIGVPIPHSVQAYNKNMGGTDRMDQNINAYSISIRGKKWWWSLFTWLLDVTVQNAWQLARTSSGKADTTLTQLRFRRELAMSYLVQHKNLPKAAGRKPKYAVGSDLARFDKREHFVRKTVNNKQRRVLETVANRQFELSVQNVMWGCVLLAFSLITSNKK